MTFDDALHECEPEPDTLLLGGDERLEETAADGRVDPGAGVFDSDTN